MSGHTPGPYKADTVSADTGCIGISALDGRVMIASVHNGASIVSLLRDGKPDTQWANARLLAAAPEMLEALQLLQGQDWQAHDDEFGNEIKRRALAAIAKATGGRS